MIGAWCARATRHSGSVGLIAAILLVSQLCGCEGIGLTRYFEQGAVVTAAPIATNVGVDILKSGGNAFDAAVAVGFVLAVVHPEAGNIGGGGFALIRNGSDSTIMALDFRETAPLAATETMYLDEDDQVRTDASTYGALAAGVPGTVAGLYELWQEYGTMSWERLVTPAAKLADTGFVVDEHLAKSLAEYSQVLAGFMSTAKQYLPGGRAPVAGQKLLQPELAATLYLIAAEGPDGFYRGKVADKMVATMQEHGGLIDHADLEDYTVRWRSPIKFRFDSLDIYSMPPPSSGGICVGQILACLQPFDFAAWSPKSIEYMHIFTEASRLAFADRSEHLGDPDYYDVPSALLDQQYLKRRIALIDVDQATPSQQVTPGTPGTSESDQTTHYNVCDGSGNMVAITYTLNSAYGCKLVVEGAGFLLNNEMDDFSIKPGHPNIYGLVGGEANKIEPGKRMLSSMSPTLVILKDRPFMALGSPGGSKIITAVAQAIVNFTRFNLTLNETVAQPRFHHQWLPDVLYLEQGSFDINVIQGLIVRGHSVKEREPYSDLQIIHYSEDGLMAGASDPRGGGSVAGF